MNTEIVEESIRFCLHGIGGVVEGERYGEVGFRLMNELWQMVNGAKVPTTGIDHWVYLPDGRMFVGVELRNPQPLPTPDPLEPLEFELKRHMKHVHVGPYQALPQKWTELKAELAARGEVIGSPSLEVYGHHCGDQSKLETTILIGLRANRRDRVGLGQPPRIHGRSSSHKSFGPSPTAGVVCAASISRSKSFRSSRRVNIANSPEGVRGHASGGRSQYNSTPLSSGSRRYNTSLTPWSLAPSSEMPASKTRRRATASAFLVG